MSRISETIDIAPNGLNARPVSDYRYVDFVYSVSLTADSSKEGFELTFGKDDAGEAYWMLGLNFAERKVAIEKDGDVELKSTDFDFSDGKEYQLTLVVNDGVAKVYIGEGGYALLAMDLATYEGGKLSENLDETNLVFKNESLLSLNSLSGDIFCCGYEVKKIINLGDGNYRLKADEYTVNKGVVTISQSYLNTLETATEYKFRAVTSFTDLDFYVETDEIGATAMPSVEKYYRGDDVRFELSEDATVSKVLVDGEEVDFTQRDEIVVLASKDVASITSGEHRAKFFTANGRPETKFKIYESVEVIPELPAPVSHTFFFIDISIFAALIVGYIVISQVVKRRAK